MSLVCRMCHIVGLTRDHFSKTQLQKPHALRSCRKCLSSRSLPSSSLAGTSVPSYPTTTTIPVCGTTTTSTTAAFLQPPPSKELPHPHSPDVDNEKDWDSGKPQQQQQQHGVLVSPNNKSPGWSPTRRDAADDDDDMMAAPCSLPVSEGGGVVGNKRRSTNDDERHRSLGTIVPKKPRGLRPGAAGAALDPDNDNNDNNNDGVPQGEVLKARLRKQQEQMDSLRLENSRLLAELKTLQDQRREEDQRGDHLDHQTRTPQADVDRFLAEVKASFQEELVKYQQDVQRLTELNEILGKDRDYNKQELDKVRDRKNYYREWARKSGETLQLLRQKIKERQNTGS